MTRNKIMITTPPPFTDAQHPWSACGLPPLS